MDGKDDSNYVFNFKLLRWTALYRILDPASANVFGYNVYHVAAMYTIFVMLATAASLVAGLYYLMNVVTEFAFYSGCIVNFAFASWKMFVVLYYSKDIWNCMKVSGLHAMAYRRYDQDIFKTWRSRSIRLTYTYTILNSLIMLSWSLPPLVFNDTMVSIRKSDGTYNTYRMNIYNFFIMVSDESYNDNFLEFYLAEFMIVISSTYITTVFDLLTLTVMLSLYFQLETIGDALRSLGHDDDGTRSTPPTDVSVYSNRSSVKMDKYDDLKLILRDHQHVMKQIEDYYNLFRSTFLIQIITASTSLILIVYIALISFVTGNAEDFKLTIQLIVVLPIFTFQLFITCYLFGIINEKKDAIVFALYSSNWTEMDLKSKKLILLAMKMNNSNQLKLKLTNTKIIDLEMFTSTIQTCYSIISMLSNKIE